MSYGPHGRNSNAPRLLISVSSYLIVWVEINSLFFVNVLGDNRNWRRIARQVEKRSLACPLSACFQCLVTCQRLSDIGVSQSTSVVQSNHAVKGFSVNQIMIVVYFLYFVITLVTFISQWSHGTTVCYRLDQPKYERNAFSSKVVWIVFEEYDHEKHILLFPVNTIYLYWL